MMIKQGLNVVTTYLTMCTPFVMTVLRCLIHMKPGTTGGGGEWRHSNSTNSGQYISLILILWDVPTSTEILPISIGI